MRRATVWMRWTDDVFAGPVTFFFAWSFSTRGGFLDLRDTPVYISESWRGCHGDKCDTPIIDRDCI